MLRRILLTVSAVAAAAQTGGLAAAPAVTIDLRQSVTVSSKTLAIGDLASVAGHDQALAARVRAAQAGNAPWPGQTLTVDAAHVLMRLKQARIDTAGVVVSGSRQCRISRASQKVAGADLGARAVEAVTAAWQGTGRIECEVTRPPADVTLPAGKLEISCQPQQPRAGVMTAQVGLSVEGASQRTISVTLRVRVFSDAMVASRAIARGQQITDSDVVVQEREVAPGTGPQEPLPAVEGTKAARDIASGAVIRASDLDVIPLVRKNAPVVLVATSGGVTVRATAVATEDGLLGQIVKVRPDYSKDTVSARVAGDGRVEIGI